MILIGSAAIKHHFPDFNREPKDLDFIVKQPMKGNRDVEYLYNPVLCDLICDVLPANIMYTLKISHLFWDKQWSKHMYDVQFLKSKGCVLHRQLFYELYAYWQTVHGENKRSDLEQTAEDFFNNALKKYDHDFLHTLINPNPTYKKVIKDGAEVEVDENKYNALKYQEKIDLVREEIYAMAYERLAGRHYRTAYAWMLKKFIINHAPLYEALFIIENYNELSKPIINYKNKLDYELSRINCGS